MSKDAYDSQIFVRKALLPGALAGASLYILTALWVSVMPQHAGGYFVKFSLFNRFQPRAVFGTIVQLLGPHSAFAIMQFFKLAYLMLISTQFFHWIKSRYIALLFCIMFAFNNPIFNTDHRSIFIDMVMNFWLLAAASLIVGPLPEFKPGKLRFGLAAILLCLTLLTHEMSLFSGFLLVTWAVLVYRKAALDMFLAWGLFAGNFLWETWNPVNTNLTPSFYFYSFIHGDQSPGHKEAFTWAGGSTILGVVSAGEMLWVIYIIAAGWFIYTRPDRKSRWEAGIYAIAAFVITLLPIRFTADTSRVVSGIWLLSYIFIVSQANAINDYGRSFVLKSILSLLCIVHVLFPPYAVEAQRIMPLNAYAESHLDYFLDSSFWMAR